MVHTSLFLYMLSRFLLGFGHMKKQPCILALAYWIPCGTSQAFSDLSLPWDLPVALQLQGASCLLFTVSCCSGSCPVSAPSYPKQKPVPQVVPRQASVVQIVCSVCVPEGRDLAWGVSSWLLHALLCRGSSVNGWPNTTDFPTPCVGILCWIDNSPGAITS